MGLIKLATNRLDLGWKGKALLTAIRWIRLNYSPFYITLFLSS